MTPWTAACQASLSITNSWSLLKLMSFELVMSSNHLILSCPLLLLLSVFCSIRVFHKKSVHIISSCTTSTPGPHRGKPKSSRAEENPNDDLHAEVEIKPQLKARGSVAKEEDPKPSHQLYKLQIKSTQSTRQTLCLWNI